MPQTLHWQSSCPDFVNWLQQGFSNADWLGQSLMTCNLEIASINCQRDTGGKAFSLLVLDTVMLLQKAIPSFALNYRNLPHSFVSGSIG